MKGRDKLLFNLLTFLILVVVVLVGVKTRDADKQIKRWQADIQRRQERGVEDPVLRSTVEKLETDLKNRINETFELEPDPLDLTRVIKSRSFIEKMMGRGENPEAQGRMRLSATIMGEHGGTAVLKYKGRSHVLEVGDWIGPEEAGGGREYKVTAVTTNSIKLQRGNEVLTLFTEKAPDSKAAEELIMETAGVPKVEVKEVLGGNF